jgi:hypothetical protein
MVFNKKVNDFCLNNIRKKVAAAVEELSKTVYVEFPKKKKRWLSEYIYKKLKIRIDKDGTVRGGILRIIFSLIDFSFVRSLLADTYGIEGGDCHDPVTLLLLEIIKIWEGYKDYPDFIKDLKDRERGNKYRHYTGINIDCVPCEATMHNFRDRVGEEKLQEICKFIVQIFSIVGIISGNILCTDGTLIEAFARYKGCTYGENCCRCIECKQDIGADIAQRIDAATKELKVKDKESSVVMIKMQCPREEILKKIIDKLKKKDPDIDLDVATAFSVMQIRIVKKEITELNQYKEFLKTLFGDEFTIPQGYSIEIMSCGIFKDVDGCLKLDCPRASKDIEARIGYRRDKENPNKLERIFGFKAVIITSVEVEFNLEIPVAFMTGAGNISEAEKYVRLHKALKNYSNFRTEYQIMDSGYDYEYVYEYVRSGNCIPIIDYNKRREKHDDESLRKRGYDTNGRPFAPCGRVCKPNGYDYEKKALKNICGKQCLKCADTVEMLECQYRENENGYTKSMSIHQLPRLICEIPRGTKRYKEIKKQRTASERTNSSAKEWTGLKNLRVWGLKAYAVQVSLSCIIVMFKRIAEFILKMTLYNKNPLLAEKKYKTRVKEMAKKAS